MGGKGSGRPRTKVHGDWTLQEKGRYNLNASKRFKSFSYYQNNQKFYGLKDKFTGVTYKRLNEESWEYTLRRFAKEDPDKILSRMDIYTKEGLANRAETARKNVISALNQMFDKNASFSVNGKTYTLEQLIDKLEDLENSEKWINFAVTHSDIIDSFFQKYRAEIGIAPDEMAGIADKNYQENIGNESDSIASENYEKMFSFVEDLITTFKI